MSDVSSKTVLVTGAAGFIGSHLVESLASMGAEVRAFIRYTSRADLGLLSRLPKNMLSNIEIQAGDLRDEDAIRKAVNGCELVFHLGALISIPYSYRHPVEVAQVNYLGTLNILQACRDNGVDHLIHASSSEVYGTALKVPISENHPLQGQSPYSASKIGADKLVESYYCSYDLPVVTVRPFNTYGPRQSSRAVIPTIITQALAQDQINLGNQNARRDFTYVSDTVNGFIYAAQAERVLGKTFNLGTGTEISITDLANKIIQLINPNIAINLDKDRLRPDRSEVDRLLSDNSSASDQLNWTPQVSLDEGLNRTIQWIRENLDHYRIGTYEL